MDARARQRVESVSRELAEFIVGKLEWDGQMDSLLGEDPVSLPEILDSADLLELAAFVEDEFNIVVEDDEIVPETFGSVAELAVFVVDKHGTGPSADEHS